MKSTASCCRSCSRTRPCRWRRWPTGSRLSPTPCWKRIQKLEAAGVITRRVALLDPDSIGMRLTAFVAVEASSHTVEWMQRFATGVSAMPEVMEIYRMAGEVDYMLRVTVADMGEFDLFYKRLIAVAPLKNVTSRFAMERMKHTTAYALPDAAFRDRRGNDSDDETTVPPAAGAKRRRK